MIDISNESLCSLPEACKLIPGRPHLATVYRWFQRGCKGGIKLETCLVGGRRFTSREAVQRFVDRLSGAPSEATAPRTPRQRAAASAKANAELQAAGW